tara:strand:+ start:10403 stop:11305 length:903 start_codon:yes stop_codon:yes gene_type:complete
MSDPKNEHKSKLDYSFTGLEDTSKVQEKILEPSTLETIDESLYDFVNELDIFATTNQGFKKVPVIWTSAERAFHIKESPDLHDLNGNIILPVISIVRGNITKDPANRGGIYANALPQNKEGGTITIARRIKQDKTSNFANADAKRLHNQSTFKRKNTKVVYETITMPLPVYVDVEYSIYVRTEYQQQMNEITTPFLNVGRGLNYFSLGSNGHRFEGFIDPTHSFETNALDVSDQEKTFLTTINLKVRGYLVGDDKNQAPPKLVKTQNAVEVRLPKEHVIMGDIPETRSKAFYREQSLKTK